MELMKHLLAYRRCWINFKRFKSIKSDKRVLVITNNNIVPQSAISLLSSRFKTTVNQIHTKEAILASVPGINGILWAAKVKLDKDIIRAAGPQLEIVASMSAGLDHIDVEELKERGIKLSNTPRVLDGCVADIAVLLTLAAGRRLHEGRLQMENGNWTQGVQTMLGQDICESTVGIVGLGGIGQTIVKRLRPFEVTRFLYTGHKEKEEGKKLGAEFVSLDHLLKQSDFIIVCCPFTSETKEMFNESAFSKMKKTAVFVNVARGEIVDQPALIKALKHGTIFAAGLDVMTPEPLPPNHELLNLPNCVVIPHLGSATIQTRKNMGELAAKNIVKALENEQLLTPVY